MGSPLRDQRVWLDIVLRLCRDWIAQQCAPSGDRVTCYLVMPESRSEQNPTPPGDLYYELTPGPQRPWPGAVTGGGNEVFYIRGLLEVAQWCRLWTDQEGRDENLLLDRQLGSLQKWLVLCGAMQLFDPLTPDGGHCYLAEPARLDDGGFHFQPRRPRMGPGGWGYIGGTWQIYYVAAVAPAQQPPTT